MELFCKQSPVYGVFWPLLPHPSTNRNEHELGLPFLPRNLRKNMVQIRTHFYSYHGHRHTDTHKPTPVKTYSLAFAGIIKNSCWFDFNFFCPNIWSWRYKSPLSSAWLDSQIYTLLHTQRGQTHRSVKPMLWPPASLGWYSIGIESHLLQKITISIPFNFLKNLDFNLDNRHITTYCLHTTYLYG